MPDAPPAHLPLEQALDAGLAMLFGAVQAEVIPASLIRLADRLEADREAAQGFSEARVIAQSELAREIA